MDAATVALVLGAFFTAAFLKGITGLGFSTICLGLLAAAIDLKLAIPLAIVPSLSSNVMVMIDAGRFREALARFWPLYLAALPGIAAGLWLLDTVDTRWARAVLGAVLFLYGVWGLWSRPVPLARRVEPWLNAPVGLATGVINGLTGSQVMPVLPYLLGLGLPRELFVQAINVSFTASSLVMLAGLVRIDLMTLPVLAVAVAGIAPVAIGIHLGGRIRRRTPEALFRRLVMGLLVVLGAALIGRSP